RSGRWIHGRRWPRDAAGSAPRVGEALPQAGGALQRAGRFARFATAAPRPAPRPASPARRGGRPPPPPPRRPRARRPPPVAESACSVGCLIFFGVFAMSVVASYYAGPEQRWGRFLTALRARLSLEIPSGTPSGSRQSRAAQTIHRRSAILSAWHTEGNCLLR